MVSRRARTCWSLVAGLACAVVPVLATSCGGSRQVASTPPPAPSCYDGGSIAPEPDDPTRMPAFHGPMAVVEPTHMVEQLTEVGLDPKNLPPFDKLTRRQKGRVMKTFSASLGIECIGCHDLSDFRKPSPRKRVARHMWDDMTRLLAMDDGSGGAVYCDSCHQGRLPVLVHSDKKLVAGYMEDIMVGKLKRLDGKDHDCGTCHGDPPEFHLVDEWRKP